jgi:hypothetical protein
MIPSPIELLDPAEHAAYDEILARCPAAQLACETHASMLHHELARHAILTVALAHAPESAQRRALIALDILTETALWGWTRGSMQDCECGGDLPYFPELHARGRE